jgi:hypothetical protein
VIKDDLAQELIDSSCYTSTYQRINASKALEQSSSCTKLYTNLSTHHPTSWLSAKEEPAAARQ